MKRKSRISSEYRYFANIFLQKISDDISELKCAQTNMSVRIEQIKRRHTEVSLRVLKVRSSVAIFLRMKPILRLKVMPYVPNNFADQLEW